MKKVFVMAVAAALLCGCEKEMLTDDDMTGGIEVAESTKKFTFTVKGDFDNAVFVDGGSTRVAKYLTGSDNQMTDLWLFDFIGDNCVQSIHQTTADASWGQPQMALNYGTHHIYFVASRGTTPTLDAGTTTITWEKPSDTFWADYEVTVVNTSNGNRAVTLDRVSTKLKVTATDEVPAGTAIVEVTPNTWYYGMNYRTGEPTAPIISQPRVITVPSNYTGTTGTLSVSIFGFSSATEWTTDVTLATKDSDGNAIGGATIYNAAFKRNRASEYSGGLFRYAETESVAINDEWTASLTGTF